MAKNKDSLFRLASLLLQQILYAENTSSDVAVLVVAECEHLPTVTVNAGIEMKRKYNEGVEVEGEEVARVMVASGESVVDVVLSYQDL